MKPTAFVALGKPTRAINRLLRYALLRSANQHLYIIPHTLALASSTTVAETLL